MVEVLDSDVAYNSSGEGGETSYEYAYEVFLVQFLGDEP